MPLNRWVAPEKADRVHSLKKEGNSYAGTIAVGKTKEVAIKNLRIDDEDSFSFEFVLTLGNKISPAKAKLDVISDIVLGSRLMGSWYLDDGSYGALDLSLKK